MAAEMLRECARWVRQQDNLQHIYVSNGGWEQWAQVDFGGYLRSKDFGVTLDDSCFAGSTSTSDLTVRNVACVKLKTFGYRHQRPESLVAYRSRVLAAQLEFQNLTLNSNNKNLDKFCVGVANLDDMISGLRHMFNDKTIDSSGFVSYLNHCFGPDFEHATVSSSSGMRWVISFCKVD